MLAYFFWNPSSIAFTIPYFNCPIRWYGLFFAFGIYGAVVIVRNIIANRAPTPDGFDSSQLKIIDSFVESLSLYTVIGLIIGARLGHVLFYDLDFYLAHPEEIPKVWHSGLSSHGAVVGLLCSLWLFSRKRRRDAFLPQGLDLLDVIAIGSAFTAGCIRCGNFFNQEIIGIPTTLPWAIVFGSPQDCSGAIPRHPVQLYEALVSFLLLASLYLCEQKRWLPRGGVITGLYLIATFTSRVFLETLKAPQCSFDTGPVHMGQLLSIPFILLGFFLLLRPYVKRSGGQISHNSEK